MHPKTLASRLDGKQFRNMRMWLRSTITDSARLNNLVIVCGYSDDVVWFKGVVEEEINAVSGNLKTCIMSNNTHTFVTAKYEKGTWTIDVEGGAPFNIYDLDRLFCQGMVFKLKG